MLSLKRLATLTLTLTLPFISGNRLHNYSYFERRDEVQKCQPYTCNGPIIVSNYEYTVDSFKTNDNGGVIKFNVDQLKEILNSFYADKNIQLIFIYKFLREMFKENDGLVDSLLEFDLSKFEVNDVVAKIIWDFFSEPERNLEAKESTDPNEQKKLDKLIISIVENFLNQEEKLYNLKDLIADTLEKSPEVLDAFKFFTEDLFYKKPDIKDLIKKIILKLLVKLENEKADIDDGSGIGNDKTSDKQLASLIKQILNTPKIKEKFLPLALNWEIKYNLIPAHFLKLLK